MCNESCHRLTFALFSGVVAASSNLRQEIGALDDNIKAKLLVSYRYVDTSNILVVQARFHRTTNTQQPSWDPLHGLRNNGASRRTRRLTASRIGGKIWFILCPSKLTSLHFSPIALLGQRRLRPSPYAVSLMTEKQYRSPDVKQPDEAPSAQPVCLPPPPPVMPSAISTPATQKVPENDLPAGGHVLREDTHTDPEIDSPASDSDTSDPPRRSTRVRRRPARYNDFVIDSN